LVADLVAGTDMISIFPSRYARSLSQVLDAHPLPVDFASYKVSLYWDRRTEDDAGLAWLRQQIVQIASANYLSE
jgi:DNA-binding transcriptional LysR family regulator